MWAVGLRLTGSDVSTDGRSKLARPHPRVGHFHWSFGLKTIKVIFKRISSSYLLQNSIVAIKNKSIYKHVFFQEKYFVVEEGGGS